MRQSLDPDFRHRLQPQHTNLLIRIEWDSSGEEIADLDLGCVLLDAQGRSLETVDFNNPTSSDGACGYGGDEVGADEGRSDEELFIDTRKINDKCHSVALVASQFAGSFGSSMLDDLEVFIVSLAFRDAASERPWQERAVLKSETLFRGRLVADHFEAESDDDEDYLSLGKDDNFVVLFDLTRCETADKAAKALARLKSLPPPVLEQTPCNWTVCGRLAQSYSRTRSEVTHQVQQSMVSLFPWLAVEDKLAFHSVGDICAQLSSQTLPRLKPRFLKQMDGLDIDQFIHAVFPALADVEPILKSSEREAANCVRLVGELFRQIDVNGDGKVDWEEFTNFTIAVGTGSSTSKGGTTADEFEIRYILDEGHIRTSQKHKSIHRMHCAHALKSRIFVIRKETNGFECWDRLARFEHDFYFPEIGEGKEEIQLDGYVHDIHYVPEKKSLVVALSDHTWRLMQEVLNCNGAHRTYKVTGQVVTVSVHRILIWANTIKALFTICGKNRLHCWDIDDALKAQRSENDVNAHNGEVVTDLVFLRDKGLLATSSLDKKVKLWDVDNLMPRGTLQGHSLGVRCLSYAQGLLVSGAFDCKIVCWDVTSHEQVVVLEGHRRAISYVALVAETAENVHVQTLDDDGDCKYWKVDRDGGIATQVDNFKLPYLDPSGPTRNIVRPNNRELSQEDWPDLLVGGAKLFRLIPSKSMKDFQAPAACLYNKTSKDYVLAVGKALVVYEATTGFYARRIPLGRQISAAAFDVPRERRVVLGTENGEVLVVNYISGEVISKIRAHQGEIVGVAHGGDKARCVISAGRDNCLKVHQETSKGLELLRTVENAQSWVGSLAYSPVLSLIATGSRSGRVALWDFCTLQQMQNLQCRGAVASVLFLDPRPLLLTGDAHGSIIMWLVRPKKQVSTLCIIEGAGSGITSLTRFDSTHHIAAGTDDGLIVMWDALTIESIAPISLLERPDRDATYKPYRKAHRDQGRCDYAKIIECDTSDTIEPLASVKAHDDAVLYVLGVDRPQCIYSTSSDGVQRLWRLDELHIQTESEIDSFAGPAPAPIAPETILACCGCFDLPNKPADTFTSFTEVEWDYFDREKAAATAKDRERAKTMLTMVQRKRDMKQVFRRAVKKVMLVLAFGGRVELANEFRDDEGVQKEWARRLDQRSIGQRDASMRRSRMRTDRACEGTGPAAREGLRNKVIAQMGSPTPPPKIVSGPQRRVNDFMARISRIPEARPAFSEPSIRNGIKEGLYHGEEERYLTQLREYPEKLEAYARRVNGGHANMPLGSDTVIEEEPLVKIENGFPVITKGVRHVALDDVARSPTLVRNVQEKMDDETTLTSGKKAVKTRMEHHRRRSLKRRPSTVNITELVRPNYTEKDVQAFQDAFEFVDVDFSGMIDMEEWFLFLRRMEQRLNPVEAQLLFLHLDSDRDGLLTMLELLQIVFSKLERRDQVALHKVCWDAHLHLAARRKQKDMELLIQKRTERLLGRGGDDSSVGSRSVGSFTLSTVTGVL